MADLVPQIKQMLSALFNVDADALLSESSTETVDGWDSLGQLMVIVELEQRFNIQISPEQGEELTSIGKIESFLKSHLP